uniref:ABC-type lipoprotein export system, ATPase component n=1 Tax=Candidatus Kentrum sp. TC TaxID=2126339 RepID=A0A451AF19_9GAMM|nr:MAG: ABC-type lipoprotein export system, ATPase component [Candidatus Kentron sp. TC]
MSAIHQDIGWLVRTSPLRRTYFKGSDDGKGRERLHFPAIRLERGGLIAIVGASGVGKTTLLNLLSGLDVVDATDDLATPPRILLDIGGEGVDIVGGLAPRDRERIGFVFQQGHLLPNASVALNMAIPSLTRGNALSRDRIEGDLGEKYRLPVEFRTKRAWQLSSGQAQRIALSRAFLHEPAIVFADEPTSSLDARLADEIMRDIKHGWLARDRTRTVLWVTHDYPLAAEYADRVLVLVPQEGGNHAGNRLYCVPNPHDEAQIRAWVYGEKSFPGLQAASDDAEEIRSTSVEEKPRGMGKIAVGEGGRIGCRVHRLAPFRNELRLATKLAVGEMFSRRHGIERMTRGNRLDLWLARTDPREKPEKGRGFWGAIAHGYADYASGIVLGLSALLITLAVFAWFLNERIYEENLASPLNCQAVLTGKAGEAGRSVEAGAIDILSKRPWWPSRDAADLQPKPGFAYAQSSCKSGPAAFGRRNLRTWPVGISRDGDCIDTRFNAQLLITLPNEPLLAEAPIVANSVDANEVGKQTTLSELLLDPDYFPGDDIYVSQEMHDVLKKNTGTDGFMELCLIDSVDDDLNDAENHYLLSVRAVVEEIPSSRQGGYDAMISDETYRRIAQRFRIPEDFYTNAVVYFDPERVETIKRYFLPDANRSTGDITAGSVRRWFVNNDVFERIERILRNAQAVRIFILFLSGAIGSIVFIYLVNSALQFLEMNKRALAVLLSFGVRESLLVKSMSVRILINFHMWFPFLLVLGGLCLGRATWFGWLSFETCSSDMGPMMARAITISWIAVVAISLLVARLAVWNWRRKTKSLSRHLA